VDSAGVENTTGGTAADLLYGNGSVNTFNGPGGEDTIDVADGNARDTVDCGPGTNTLTIDATPGLDGPISIDTYNQENCETITKELISD
jgi:hypothetical protein